MTDEQKAALDEKCSELGLHWIRMHTKDDRKVIRLIHSATSEPMAEIFETDPTAPIDPIQMAFAIDIAQKTLAARSSTS